jgi:3-hydroxymyristoyl/3-hydroxydecanoyl-(acyl carrier protein) dehydratase
MVFAETPGHFPGNPIVPGAVLLGAVAERLALTGVPRVRFLAIVRPGEEVALRAREPHDGLVHFSLWRGDVEVVRGIGRR